MRAGQESNLESFGSEPNVLPITLPANIYSVSNNITNATGVDKLILHEYWTVLLC